ncbi:VanZ family protein [Paenibacillus sp. ClWae2A]|uniref:VanZ family protein n=1 Tax=Paenibacillus sp. ClWae2A TaxID=3057177 RepID=UPI0028F536F7|nr:VanZ family protein [Paenibacillus sp. ClWae2A]MDT9721334.1 VanZ family protein [Paenibacillus sp. ClWae2A]
MRTLPAEGDYRKRRHKHRRRQRPYIYILSLLLITIWVVVIWSMSAQSYQQQTIQPWLHQWSEQIQWVLSLPDIQFTYGEHHYSLNARPYDFAEFIFRKTAHIFVYAVLAVLVYCGMRYRRSGMKTCIRIALATVIVIASIDEYIQQFSPNRTASIRDVGVDLIGGLCGVMLWIAGVAIYRKLRSFRRSHR